MVEISYPTESPGVKGKLIIDIEDGKFVVYPIANSDDEAAVLLQAFVDHLNKAARSAQQRRNQ